ncbi:anti-phage protein Ppl [Aliivibrio fischeri]|uniref:anti-phage protein Ppl n=1 Tax=Aliivibrio fischeri TaxID=668 RepID=UPI001668C2CD|nr:anti-phage protein Ppl [Aliivibrio fischeri]
MQIVGSKWFKVDFHCHSPASDDFPRSDRSLICTSREWLLGQMSNEVDCVVLSDHNTGSGLDTIRAELDALKAESDSGVSNGYRDIVIMPAVELTAAGNVHVLAILQDDATSSTISELVGSCGLPSTQGKNHSLELTYGTRGIIEAIHGFSTPALAILAHVDMHKGIFKNSNQGSVSSIFDANPDAIELIGEMDALETYQKKLIEDLAWVKGSDAHSIDEMGQGYTWVKMIKPSFEGLKVALSDPKHCIKRGPKQPPAIPSQQITKLTLKTKMCQDVNGNPISIDLSPWYTSIVGSRGSGKSTLIEAIRLSLRRDENLPLIQQSNIDVFKKAGPDGAMSPDSFIELEYRKGQERYKLTWSPTNTHFHHLNKVSGLWEEEETFNTSRFPVSIYSQKMLYEMATQPNSFLRVIDESETVNYAKWEQDKLNLETKYKQYCSDEREALRSIENLTITKGQLQDVDRKLQTLKEAGLESLQQTLTNDKEELSKAEGSKQKVDDLIETLESACAESTVTDIDDPESDLGKWQLEVNEIHDTLSTAVLSLIDESKAKLIKSSEQSYLQTLKLRISDNTSELSTKVSDLNNASIDHEELSALMDSQAEFQLVLNNEQGLKDELALIQANKADVYEQLVTHRENLTTVRNQFIADLGLVELKIQVLPLACSSDRLVKSYQAASGIERFESHIFDEGTPNSLLYDLNSFNKFNPKSAEQRYSELAKLKRFHIACVKKEGSSDYAGIHGSLRTRLGQLQDERLDDLHCWFPDDGLQIQFQDSIGEFRQLERASPGQKSASMLSFLMSYGEDPLILDQPEDDLDCAMLASSVIPAISNNKKRRQLVVVTHSAPIVVNGDAELVVGMKQQAQRLEPHISGGLQEEAVKAFICFQMEGGEKAFRTRFKRIIG